MRYSFAVKVLALLLVVAALATTGVSADRRRAKNEVEGHIRELRIAEAEQLLAEHHHFSADDTSDTGYRGHGKRRRSISGSGSSYRDKDGYYKGKRGQKSERISKDSRYWDHPKTSRKRYNKNVYHEEESRHSKKYYDDNGSDKYHNDYDTYGRGNKGSEHRESHLKRRDLRRSRGGRKDVRSNKNFERKVDNKRELLKKHKETIAKRRTRDKKGKKNREDNERKKRTNNKVDVKKLQTEPRRRGRSITEKNPLQDQVPNRRRPQKETKDQKDRQCRVRDLKNIVRYLSDCQEDQQGRKEDVLHLRDKISKILKEVKSERLSKSRHLKESRGRVRRDVSKQRTKKREERKTKNDKRGQRKNKIAAEKTSSVRNSGRRQLRKNSRTEVSRKDRNQSRTRNRMRQERHRKVKSDEKGRKEKQKKRSENDHRKSSNRRDRENKENRANRDRKQRRRRSTEDHRDGRHGAEGHRKKDRKRSDRRHQREDLAPDRYDRASYQHDATGGEAPPSPPNTAVCKRSGYKKCGTGAHKCCCWGD